ESSGDQDLAIEEQRRGGRNATVLQRGPGGPSAGVGMVQFGAPKGVAAEAAGNEDGAITQECGGVSETGRLQRTRGAPRLRSRVIELAPICRISAEISSPRDQNVAIREKSCSVMSPRAHHGCGGGPLSGGRRVQFCCGEGIVGAESSRDQDLAGQKPNGGVFP